MLCNGFLYIPNRKFTTGATLRQYWLLYWHVTDSHFQAIPAKIKLQVTLSFLATGNSYRNLQQSFRVSKAAISKFVPEVCNAIYEHLQDFLQVKTKVFFIVILFKTWLYINI